MLALFVLAWAGTGVPGNVLDALARRFNKQGVALSAESATVGIVRGLRVAGVRFARPNIAEPSWGRIGMLRARIRPRLSLSSTDWVHSIRLDDVSLSHWPTSTTPSRALAPWPEARFNLDARRVRVLGVPVDRVRARVRLSDARVELTDLVLRMPSNLSAPEILRGRLSLERSTGAVTMQIAGRANPSAWLPLFEAAGAAGFARIVRRFDLADMPAEIEGSMRWAPRPGECRLDMEIALPGGTYRNVPFEYVSATIAARGVGRWDSIEIFPLTVTRPEGRLWGALRIEPPEKRIGFLARSTLAMDELNGILNLFRQPPSTFFVCEPPLMISGSGSLTYSTPPKDIDVTGSLRCPLLRIDRFTLQDATVHFRLSDTAFALTSASATLAGGSLDAQCTWWRNAQDGVTGRTARAHLRQADFGRLCEEFSGRESSFGGITDMALDLDIPGKAIDRETIRGEGVIAVRDAALFRMRLFAGLTSWMANTIPGVSALVNQTDADIHFNIAEGALHTDQARIEGHVFSVNGQGRYDFTDGLDFAIQVRLFRQETIGGKVMRVIGYPFSRLFQMHLSGTLDVPQWQAE